MRKPGDKVEVIGDRKNEEAKKNRTGER